HGFRIQPELADFDDVRLRPCLAARSTHLRANPRQELARGKGLRHIVVGAAFEAYDAVVLLRSRGDHDDGRVEALAYPAADVESTHSRKHQVEEDDVRSLAECVRKRRFALRSPS